MIAKEEKEAIAQAASAHVEEGDTLILDAGTTTGAPGNTVARSREGGERQRHGHAPAGEAALGLEGRVLSQR